MARTEFWLGMLAGIIGIIAGVIAMMIGGVAGAFGAEGASTVVGGSAIAIIASIVGIIGSAMTGNNPKRGGWIMIICGIVGFIGIFAFYIISGLLFIAGGWMAIGSVKSTKPVKKVKK